MHQLSRKLGNDQPFYGIEPEGLDGKRFQRLTVQQMAAHYIAEIRKVQPVGPYYLGGYCFGGLVAFEMAQQLLSQGEQAAVVALLSAALRYNQLVPRPKIQPPKRSLGTRLKRAVFSPVRSLRSRANSLYWRVKPAVRRIVYRGLLATVRRIPPGMRTMYVAQTLGRAEQDYKPQPYPGPIVLLYGRGSEEEEFGPNLGWDGLADRFEHRLIGNEILDNRRDIMNDPLVGITGKELAPYLNPQHGASLPHQSNNVTWGT
jgi:aspartate racemase